MIERIKNFLIWIFDMDHERCYSRRRSQDGFTQEDKSCCGMVGGDRFTDYLCYSCIGYPYLKFGGD